MPITKTAYKKGEKRPNQGRPRGCLNKNNQALKDMILGALHEKGGVAYLVEQAGENPTAFLSLIGKVLPLTVVGDSTQPVHFAIGLPWLQSQIQNRNTA